MHRLKRTAYVVSLLLLVGCSFVCPVVGHAQTNDDDDTEPISGLFLNDYSEFTTTGIQIDGIGSGTIDYNIPTLEADEDHTITISEVGSASVTFTLSARPAPVGATLQTGETKQYDVNGDKSNDIEIGLRSISDQLANMTFKQVVASSIAKAVPSGSTAGSGSEASGGTVVIDPATGLPVPTNKATGGAVGTIAATKQQLKSVLIAPWQVYIAVGVTVGILVTSYYRWHHRKLLKRLFETHWPNNDPDLR